MGHGHTSFKPRMQTEMSVGPEPFWIDAHCHLADPRCQGRESEIIAEAKAQHIHAFLQAGVGPEDWDRQEALAKKFPEAIACFGLHPYWVADHDQIACENALDLLARRLGGSIGLGEAGLDFRPHIMKDSAARQIEMFENQIQMAKMAKKALVIHCVRAHPEVLHSLEIHGAPEDAGLIHSFNAPVKTAKKYLDFGFYLSIGTSVLLEKNHALRESIAACPMEKLLVESDSPDQKPLGWAAEFNSPNSLILVAQAIGKIKKLPHEEVLDKARQNLQNLFHANFL